MYGVKFTSLHLRFLNQLFDIDEKCERLIVVHRKVILTECGVNKRGERCPNTEGRGGCTQTHLRTSGKFLVYNILSQSVI